MSSKTMHEGVHAAEFLLSEANGWQSREEITIPANQEKLFAGTLLTDDGAGNRIAWTSASTTPVTGVLYQNVSESDVPQKATEIVRNAEVMKSLITGYDPAADDDLAALGIILR